MRTARRIAVDIGAASARLIAGWREDGILRTQEVYRFETGDTLLGTHRVRNLYRWYDEILTGFARYTQLYGEAPDSVGVDAMGEDFALLGETGEFLFMPPSYREKRDISRVLEEEARFGLERIYRICGNQSVPNDTLRQLIALRQTYPRILRQAKGLLFLGDAMTYLLCGSPAAQHSLVSYGKLYDQQKDAYADEIFRFFDLPDALKSPVSQCGDVLGHINREIARDVGWQTCPPVIAVASHDTACAAFAVPETGFSHAFVSSGSWSLAGMPTDRAFLTREACALNLSNSSMPWRGRMIKRLLAGMWLMQRCLREWGLSDYGPVIHLAEEAQVGELMIDPDDDRFFNPLCMCRAVSEDVMRRYGARVDPGDVGVVARLIFEGLALRCGWALGRIRQVTGARPERVHVVGGGSRNALVNQMIANATGSAVLTSVTEASATGNLLCQMIGAGELSDEAQAKRLMAKSFPAKRFEPEDEAVWAAKGERFVKTFGI